jgi:integrase
VAYIYQLPSGRWRAQLELRGRRESKTFATKTAARQWSSRREAEILDGGAGLWPGKTLGDALTRYLRDVTPGKGGERFERTAAGLLRREHPALLAKPLHLIAPADIAAWRDARAAVVSGSTVQRYAKLLRVVWSSAAEWGWCPRESPISLVRMPAHNPPRGRLLRWQEVRRILRRLGYVSGAPPTTAMQEVAWAWLIALRTAMRAGEVLALRGEHVDLRHRVVTLPRHKTSHRVGSRDVPITRQAARLLSVLHRPGALFGVPAGSRDALFRKARDQVMARGLTFHDSRATALTLLARRVDILTLARISGHADIRQLQAYYRESDRAIAARL